MTATTVEPTAAAAAAAAAPAAPAAPKVDTNSWGWGIARKNQKTGARIVIDRTAREGAGPDRVYEDVPVTIDPEKGKYLMFCVDHRTLAYTDSQNTAGEQRRAPYAWCPECETLRASGKRVGALEPVAPAPKAEKKPRQAKVKPEDVPVVTTLAEQQAEAAANGLELAPDVAAAPEALAARPERVAQPATAEVEGMVEGEYTREPVTEDGEAEAPPKKRRLGKK